MREQRPVRAPCRFVSLRYQSLPVLSYRHYRRDLRDKRHLRDECSPRRRDKIVSLQSRDFFRGPRIFRLHLPALGPTRRDVRRGRSRVRENDTNISAAIIRTPLTPHSSLRDLSTRLKLGARSLRARGRTRRGGMGSIGVALVKLGSDNGIGPMYEIPHTTDAIRPFYKSLATTRGCVANLLVGASM